MLSRKKGGSIRRAYWGGGIGMGETKTFLCHFVQVRSFVEGVSVTPKLRPTQVVSENEYDVWPIDFCEGLYKRIATPDSY
jgi:hypothetical protein